MSDDARRRFLEELIDALGPGWSASYAKVRPFGVLGATLFFGEIDGYVEVVPSNVTNGVVSWDPFPTGKPHYDIHTGTGELRRTCVLENAIALLDSWRRSQLPVARTAPVPMDVALAAPQQAQLLDTINPDGLPLTREGRSVLAATRSAIDPDAIERAFPRNDDGSVVRSTQALLVKLPWEGPLGPRREAYLVVRSPSTRSARNVLILTTDEAIRDNASHDWTDAPWLWRRDAQPPAIDRRAAKCVELLQAGRFDDAFGIFGVALEPNVLKVLEGVPLGMRCNARHASAWRETLRRALWETAPWSLAKLPASRLVLLPHQRHQRKAWLAWTGTALDIEYTGSNARLPHVAWKRPRPGVVPTPTTQRAAK